MHNAELQYVRSRVEHAFGLGRCGNFFLKNYAGSHLILSYLFPAVCAATNLQINSIHGLHGAYSFAELDRKVAGSYYRQNERYGEVPEFVPIAHDAPLPPPPPKVEKRKRMQVKQGQVAPPFDASARR